MPKTSDELLTKYAIPSSLARVGRLNVFHGGAREVAWNLSARLKPYVDHGAGDDAAKFTRLADLMDHITQTPNWKPWAEVLIYVNSYMGTRNVSMPGAACPIGFWQTLTGTALWSAAPVGQPQLLSYLTYRADAPARLHAIWAAQPSLRGTETFNAVLQFIVKSRRAGVTAAFLYERLRPDNVLNAIRMSLLFPQGATFGGFAKWGKGNHATVNANIRWHFLKHVLCISEVADEDVDEGLVVAAGIGLAGAMDELLEHSRMQGAAVSEEESALWWRALKMKLTFAEFVEHRSGLGYEELEPLFVADPTTAVRQLPYSNVARFLRGGTLSKHPRLLGFLMKYENAYRDFGLSESRSAGIARLELEAFNIFVAAFSGSVYFVGRLDEDDGHRSIALSSCYICFDVNDKMTKSARKELWALGV